jgi:hypothetical protein
MTTDDEPPTPKDSGTLPIFESTCDEAIEKLSGDDSERADELRAEARSLLVTLQGWRFEIPAPDERAQTISRVLDLHRAVSEYRAILVPGRQPYGDEPETPGDEPEVNQVGPGVMTDVDRLADVPSSPLRKRGPSGVMPK